MKFIFFGTPEFAATVLEKLTAAGYMPAAVVCNPDEPAGRKKLPTPPPVKRLIVNGKWPTEIFQPATKSELSAISRKLSSIKPDLAIIAAYGKIIPKEILDIPHRGFINVHPSLLPKYRGASPVQAAILNGDQETGVTIIEVDEEMDHGATLANSKLPIADSDTYGNLSKKLAILGAELLIKIIPDYIAGQIKTVEQDHLKATYTKIIKKQNGKIDWSKSALEIERMVRAFYPWPIAWAMWNNKILKILETSVLSGNNKKTGEVFLKGSGLAIKCSKNILIVKKLQLEGGKILTACEFLNGHRDFIGSFLE